MQVRGLLGCCVAVTAMAAAPTLWRPGRRGLCATQTPMTPWPCFTANRTGRCRNPSWLPHAPVRPCSPTGPTHRTATRWCFCRTFTTIRGSLACPGNDQGSTLGGVSLRLSRSGRPEWIGQGRRWEVMRIIGTVPMEEDGSALFRAPARTPLPFQALDEEWDRGAVDAQLVRGHAGRLCVLRGCHEATVQAPPNLTRAAHRAPRDVGS